MPSKPKFPYPDILPRVYRDVVIADPTGDKIYFIPFNPCPPWYREQECTLFDQEIEDPGTADLRGVRDLLETGASVSALRQGGRTRYLLNIGSLQVSIYMHHVLARNEDGDSTDDAPPVPGFWNYRLQRKR